MTTRARAGAPPRLREGDDELGRLVRAASAAPLAPGDRARAWARLQGSLEARRSRRGWQVGGLLAAAAAAALLVVGRPGTPVRGVTIERLAGGGERVELPAGTLEVAVGSVYRLPGGPVDGETRVWLDRGSLRAQIRKRPPGEPFAIVTPELRVVVVGTRFTVRAGAAGSAVEVEEGRVRVERAGRPAVLLGPGEALEGDGDRRAAVPIQAPAPARPAAPVAPPRGEAVPAPVAVGSSPGERVAPARRVAVAPVAGGSPAPRSCLGLGDREARRACYLRLAGGGDLAAEVAVYSLAVLARDEDHDPAAAATRFREYLARFPEGTLAREARAALEAAALR